MTTHRLFFPTEEEQMNFYNSLENVSFKMASPPLPENPVSHRYGVQWAYNEDEVKE
jgi:hypothetical protein